MEGLFPSILPLAYVYTFHLGSGEKCPYRFPIFTTRLRVLFCYPKGKGLAKRGKGRISGLGNGEIMLVLVVRYVVISVMTMWLVDVLIKAMVMIVVVVKGSVHGGSNLSRL